MYESSRGNTNPLSQPAAHTKNKSSLNEVLCTGFYSCHTLIQRLAAGFFLSQQTLIRFYWCHRTDCWLCCLQFKTCFALKQNGGGESPSAVCSRDLQSLQRTYCTWYSFLLCVCVCVSVVYRERCCCPSGSAGGTEALLSCSPPRSSWWGKGGWRGDRRPNNWMTYEGEKNSWTVWTKNVAEFD